MERQDPDHLEQKQKHDSSSSACLESETNLALNGSTELEKIGVSALLQLSQSQPGDLQNHVLENDIEIDAPSPGQVLDVEVRWGLQGPRSKLSERAGALSSIKKNMGSKTMNGPGGHDVSKPTTINGSCGTTSMRLKSTAECSNSSDRCEQSPHEEWTKSSSRMAVGLRSTTSRRSNYNATEMSPIDKRRLHQSAKKQSWLMLSSHQGSRYIPQLGDEVAYLRQGHDEYIEFSCSKEKGPWVLMENKIRAVEFCKVIGLEYDFVPGSRESCCKMTLQFVDAISAVHGRRFKLTLSELNGFPDFLVERTRFDAAIKRNWSPRDKCCVWWKNDGEEDGEWWDGRILSVKAKSPDFPESPWETCVIQYKSDPGTLYPHSPWELELCDADSQWEQPHIDDVVREKLLSSLAELDQSGDKSQDQYGVNELKEISDNTSFRNRYPVPVSLELVQLRIKNSYYRNSAALRHDIDLMMSNAEVYIKEEKAELSPKMKLLFDWLNRKILLSEEELNHGGDELRRYT